MPKRLLLWSTLFSGGMCVGFLLAWVMNSLRTRPDALGRRNQSGEPVTMTLSATIDGSDRFIFTRDHVWNDHGKWDPPKKILFNGEPWEDLSQAPPNWMEFAEALDLSKAVIVTRDGRDFVSLERTAEGFDIYFADTPMGAGQYTVTISIPRK